MKPRKTREEKKMEQEAEEQIPTPAIQEEKEEDLPPPAKKKRGRKKGQKSKPKNSTNVEVEMNPHSSSSGGGGGGGGSSSRRCTRSQAAPDWTVEETLVLVREIATMDEVWLKSLSSYQKWKMISDSCMAMQVARSSNQCKRRWEALLSDYYKIKLWEPTSSYWSLGAPERQHHHLPASFDIEVFGSIDDLLNAQDAPTDSEDITAMEEEQEEQGNITSDLEMEKMKQIMPRPSPKDNTDICIALHNKNKNDDDDNPICINMPEAEMFDADLGSGEAGSKNIVSMVLEMAKLKENTEQVHPIESIDNVKMLHNTESKENTMNMQNKLQENVEQILAINSMGNSSGMADNKLQENMEEMCVIESAEENAEQIHAIVGLDSAVNMTNKLLENRRQIHETHRGMDNALENVEQMHVTNSMKKSLGTTNKLHRNMEQRLVAEKMDNSLEMANKLQKVEKKQATKSTDNTPEMTNKLQEKMEMENKLQEHGEQVQASKHMENELEMTNKLHAIEDRDSALEIANDLREKAEEIHAIERTEARVNKLPESTEQRHAIKSTGMTLKMKLQDNLEKGHAAAIKGTKSFKMGNKHVVKSTVKELEMANKLRENAELIHAILRGDLPDHGIRGRALVDNNAMETRRQADELIKAFGTLVGTIDRFTDLIKDGGCEGIRGMDSLALYKQFRDSAHK